MDIVLGVAGIAGGRCGDASLFLLHRRFVAGVALQLRVRGIQPEPGLGMVKVPTLPGACVVTGFAIGAETALMHIIVFVTPIAVSGRVLERRGLVTLLAFHLGVAARQRET